VQLLLHFRNSSRVKYTLVTFSLMISLPIINRNPRNINSRNLRHWQNFEYYKNRIVNLQVANFYFFNILHNIFILILVIIYHYNVYLDLSRYFFQKLTSSQTCLKYDVTQKKNISKDYKIKFGYDTLGFSMQKRTVFLYFPRAFLVLSLSCFCSHNYF